MPYTGVDFKTNWQRRIDKPYNDYYDLDTLKDFFNRVLTLGVKDIYESLDLQRRFDWIRSLIVYDKDLTLSSSRILLQQLAVSDYNSGTGQFTTTFKHNVQVGSVITALLAGSSGEFDGSLTVTSVESEYKFTASAQSIGTFIAGYIETPQSVLDYLHLNSLKITYKVLSQTAISSLIVKPESIIFNTASFSKLRSGEKVIISGFTSPSAANGTFYVKWVGEKSYQLYSDKELQNPVLGNGKFSGPVGTLYEVTESETIFQSKPDQIQTYDKPSYQFPRWKMDQNALVLEPEQNLVSAKISYLRKPPFAIDPEDADTDLLLYVPQEFIEFLIDKGAALFDLETKDVQSLNMDAPQVVVNK